MWAFCIARLGFYRLIKKFQFFVEKFPYIDALYALHRSLEWKNFDLSELESHI